MSDDITFCGSDCDNKKCFRHPSNIREPRIPHSFAYLKGTVDCPIKKQEVRLIDANALKEKIEIELNNNVGSYCDGLLGAKELLDNAPTVELTETEIQDVLNKRCMTAVANEYLIALHGTRPQGEWITENLVKPYGRCNQCGQICEIDNFCGNCGARMGGEENEGI